MSELNDLQRRDFYSWMVQRYRLPNGNQYSFKGHEYLEQIAKHHWVPNDDIYIRKSSQCGASELAVGWTLWLPERNLPDWQANAYMFPATEQLRDHIKSRIMPILELPQFSGNIKQQNLRLIRYCNKPINFRAGQTRRDLIGWSSDAAVMDEFDEFADPIGAVPTVKARFNHSLYKWLFALSTPTYPDIGIDAAYSNSNRYHWHTQCDKCGKHFAPLLEVESDCFENWVVEAPISKKVGFVCPHCGDLTQTNGAPGKWELIAKGKEQQYGYSISRLFVGHANLRELLDKFEDAHNMQEFYNSDLGLPYSPANSRLSRGDIITQAIGEGVSSLGKSEQVFCGVDIGKKCHWVVGKINENGYREILDYGICGFDDLSEIFRRFGVNTLVIDSRPYEHEVKKLIAGKRNWYASDYNTGKNLDWYETTKVDTGKGKTVRVLKNDRTQTADALIEHVSIKKNIIFPSKVKGDNRFIKQMCAMQRMEKSENDTGEIKAFYGNGNKPDHFFHACAYFLLATMLKRKSGLARLGIAFH